MAWPMPVVRHFLACRAFESDFAVRDFTLRNVLYSLRPPPSASYPLVIREIHLLAQLSDGLGGYDLTVELIRLDDGHTVFRLDPVRVDLSDKLRVYNFHRARTAVPFVRPGVYVFQLFGQLLRNADGSPAGAINLELLAAESLVMEESRERSEPG